MACDPTPHVGDTVNLVVQITELVGTSQVVVNVSSASQMLIYLTNPSTGVAVPKTAALFTDGTDGKISYRCLNTDLTVEGIWRIEGFVKIGTEQYTADESTFEVKPSRHGP
jgi:hypothetical protein